MDMEFPFTFSKKIEGATIFEIEGHATITSVSGHPGDREWMITNISIDGRIPNPRRVAERNGIVDEPLWLDVDVSLSMKHPLCVEIMIDLMQGIYRDEINQRWSDRVSLQHREPAL